MKIISSLIAAIIANTVFGQGNESVDLRWKVGKSEVLQYETVMSAIDTSQVEMDFGGLFDMLSDSSANAFKEGKQFFKKLNKALQDNDYVTYLTSGDDRVIDIAMSTRPKEDAPQLETDSADIKNMLAVMTEMLNQGVILRGSVYESGAIHSFWVKNQQKNLIALLFQLPTDPVKVGDKWPLDVSLISNDQNFECDSAYKINEVTLIELKEVKGEQIAVLKYNIIEYVLGDFNMPAFMGSEAGKKETMMKLSYHGIAEFSIEQGRWVVYDGIMSLEVSGVMNASTKTKFALVVE